MTYPLSWLEKTLVPLVFRHWDPELLMNPTAWTSEDWHAVGEENVGTVTTLLTPKNWTLYSLGFQSFKKVQIMTV
jgi:hypothetical protein